jgi:hypothetical protein
LFIGRAIISSFSSFRFEDDSCGEGDRSNGTQGLERLRSLAAADRDGDIVGPDSLGPQTSA